MRRKEIKEEKKIQTYELIDSFCFLSQGGNGDSLLVALMDSNFRHLGRGQPLLVLSKLVLKVPLEEVLHPIRDRRHLNGRHTKVCRKEKKKRRKR